MFIDYTSVAPVEPNAWAALCDAFDALGACNEVVRLRDRDCITFDRLVTMKGSGLTDAKRIGANFVVYAGPDNGAVLGTLDFQRIRHRGNIDGLTETTAHFAATFLMCVWNVVHRDQVKVTTDVPITVWQRSYQMAMVALHSKNLAYTMLQIMDNSIRFSQTRTFGGFAEIHQALKNNVCKPPGYQSLPLFDPVLLTLSPARPLRGKVFRAARRHIPAEFLEEPGN